MSFSLHFSILSLSLAGRRMEEKRFRGPLLTFEDNWGVAPFIIHASEKAGCVEQAVFVNF